MTTRETLDSFVGKEVIIENYSTDYHDTYKGILVSNGLGYSVHDGIHTIRFSSHRVNAFDKGNGIPTICI